MSALMELEYTETQRDRVERKLAAQANKREINFRQEAGYKVIAYWLMKENVCSIYVEQDDRGVEFTVPNHRVGEYFIHPFSHIDANLPADPPNPKT